MSIWLWLLGCEIWWLVVVEILWLQNWWLVMVSWWLIHDNLHVHPWAFSNQEDTWDTGDGKQWGHHAMRCESIAAICGDGSSKISQDHTFLGGNQWWLWNTIDNIDGASWTIMNAHTCKYTYIYWCVCDFFVYLFVHSFIYVSICLLSLCFIYVLIGLILLKQVNQVNK